MAWAIESVFFRADETARASGSCLGFDFADIFRRIAVVIGKKLVPDNFESPTAQIGDERGGIADAAKREEVLFARIVAFVSER